MQITDWRGRFKQKPGCPLRSTVVKFGFLAMKIGNALKQRRFWG
jgi:hypothetical protein